MRRTAATANRDGHDGRRGEPEQSRDHGAQHDGRDERPPAALAVEPRDAVGVPGGEHAFEQLLSRVDRDEARRRDEPERRRTSAAAEPVGVTAGSTGDANEEAAEREGEQAATSHGASESR